MLREARKEKYLIDGFNLRNFHRFPSSIDPSNLLYEQQVFFMYLAALAPSVDEVRLQIAYLDEKEEIKKLKFEDFFDTKDTILKMEADRKGISLEDHKAKLLEPAVKRAYEELDEKYGFSVEDDKTDPRELVRQKYRKIFDKQDDIKENADMEKLKRINQLFDLPENSVSAKKKK